LDVQVGCQVRSAFVQCKSLSVFGLGRGGRYSHTVRQGGGGKESSRSEQNAATVNPVSNPVSNLLQRMVTIETWIDLNYVTIRLLVTSAVKRNPDPSNPI